MKDFIETQHERWQIGNLMLGVLLCALAQICKFFILSFSNNFLLSSSRERKRGLPKKRKKNNRADIATHTHTHADEIGTRRVGRLMRTNTELVPSQLAERRKEIKIWNNSASPFHFLSLLSVRPSVHPSIARVKLTGENMAAGCIEWLCHLYIWLFSLSTWGIESFENLGNFNSRDERDFDIDIRHRQGWWCRPAMDRTNAILSSSLQNCGRHNRENKIRK